MFGNLRMAHAVRVRKGQHLPVFAFKPLNAGLHNPAAFFVIRADRMGFEHQIVGFVILIGKLIQRNRVDGVALLGDQIQCAIANHLMQPGFWCREFVIEGVGISPKTDVRVLQHILSQAGFPNDPERHCEHFARGELIQLLERLPVAIRYSFY